jgi:hypothetical protein
VSGKLIVLLLLSFFCLQIRAHVSEKITFQYFAIPVTDVEGTFIAIRITEEVILVKPAGSVRESRIKTIQMIGRANAEDAIVTL